MTKEHAALLATLPENKHAAVTTYNHGSSQLFLHVVSMFVFHMLTQVS